jgi:hypothetical protein
VKKENEMNPKSIETVKANVKEARELIRHASRILARVRDNDDESEACWQLTCTAEVAADVLETVNSDLDWVLQGETPHPRVDWIATGQPWKEDAGGGFGRRALHALAACRAAWVGADQFNAPKMAQAAAWVAHAWLNTAGTTRVGVVRAVLTRGLDPGVAARIVASVDRCAQSIPGHPWIKLTKP